MDTIFGQIGSNLNRHFSSSVNVVVDINYLILSCLCATFSLWLSMDFNSYYSVYGKVFIINLVDTVVIMLLSCGLWMLFYFKLSVQSFAEAEGKQRVETTFSKSIDWKYCEVLQPKLVKWQIMITQMEEGSKNRGDRVNSKFVYDLNPLCPNSESVIMKPGVLIACDGPTHE